MKKVWSLFGILLCVVFAMATFQDANSSPPQGTEIAYSISESSELLVVFNALIQASDPVVTLSHPDSPAGFIESSAKSTNLPSYKAYLPYDTRLCGTDAGISIDYTYPTSNQQSLTSDSATWVGGNSKSRR